MNMLLRMEVTTSNQERPWRERGGGRDSEGLLSDVCISYAKAAKVSSSFTEDDWEFVAMLLSRYRE